MKAEPVDLLVYLGFTLLGFISKFILERYSKHKDAVRLESWRLEVANLEKKLSSLFWPLHCRLKRGDIAWKTENFRSHNKDKEGFVSAFDQEVIMQNHRETREIIQNNFHHFGGDKELEEELIKLLHHIDVYLSLRSSGFQNDPIWVGQPWPTQINSLIEKHLHTLQARYDALLRQAKNPL